MASVFSYYAASFHYSSDPHDQLTQSSCARYCFHTSRHILNSTMTVELIRLLIGTIVNFLIRHALHPFMDLRLMTPTGP